MQILQNRADEAGDEISGTGRDASGTATRLGFLSAAAGTTSGAFGTLSSANSTLSLSFGSLTTSLTGTVALLGLVGAAATGLVSTLLPLAAVVGTVTGALGALAAAFGTVIGTGILAFGEQRAQQKQEELDQIEEEIELYEQLQEEYGTLNSSQQENLEQLKERKDELEDQTDIMGALSGAFSDLMEELQPVITEFGEQFVPLIEDAIDAIPDLVRNIFSAIGGMDRFVDVLRRLGNRAFRVIPQITADIFDLARMALPVFMDFINFVGNNASSAFSAMLQVTQRLAPTLMGLGRAFLDALPELTALGTVILETVIPAVSDLLGFIEDLINMGQGSDSFTDFLDSLINSGLEWLENDGKTLIENAGDFVLSTLEDVIRPGGDEEGSGILDAFIDRVSSLLTGVETWLEEGGQEQLTSLMTTLFSGINTALTENSDRLESDIYNPLTNILSGVFDSVTEALKSDEANQLSTTLANLSREAFQFFADQLTAYAGSQAFRDDLSQLVGALANSLTPLLKQAVLNSVVNLLGGPFFASIFDEMETQFQENRGLLQSGRFQEFFYQVGRDVNEQIGSPLNERDEQSQGGQLPLVLRLEENTDLIDARIEQGAEGVVIERERRTQRNTGRSASPTR